MRVTKKYLKIPELRRKVSIALVLLVVMLSHHCAAADYPSVGSSSIIFYNPAREPIRRVANVPIMTSCAVAGPGLQAMVYSEVAFVTFINEKLGSRRIKIPGHPREMYGDKDGYIVPVYNGPVLDINLTGDVVATTKAFMALKKAIRHPQGGYVGVTSNGQLIHRKWTDEIITHVNNESTGKNIRYSDISAYDPLTFVAMDSATNEVVKLNLALQELQRHPAPIPHAMAIAVLQNALLFIGEDRTSLTIQATDGTITNMKTPLKVQCTGATQDGGFYLGFSSQDSTYIPTELYADFDAARPALTHDSLFAIVVYSVVGTMLFIWGWRFVSQKALQALRRGTHNSTTEVLHHPTDAPLHTRNVNAAGLVFLLVSFGGLYLSWRVGEQVRLTGSTQAWTTYILGASIAATSLIIIARRASLGPLLHSLNPVEVPVIRNQVSWFLLLLALTSSALCFYLNESWEFPRTVVATWLVAQVLALGAFPATHSSPRWIKSRTIQVIFLCILTAFSRAYKWTECPHDIHFDFGIIAAEAVRNMIESWSGLFNLVAGQTIGRVWLLQMSASMWAFGLDEWVVRLSSLVWSVGYVLAAYLLGRELISHRFGMVAGLLGALQHTLLGYSRLPYVIESTGPFIFCLYFLCRGIRTSSFRDWALSGLWAAWSVMSVRTCTTFPFIGAAILLYVCLVHPKVMWRLKAHALVMMFVGAITFSPFYNFYMHGQSLTHRLEGMSPLLSKDGIKTDPAIWAAQFNSGFGAILRHVDRLSWPMENAAPICQAITGSLFGCGLLLLLLRFRSLATPIILLSIGINITLGSAVLENPPSYYHHFVGTLFVMFVVAVPLEYLFEIASRIKWRVVAGAMTLLVCALTVVATDEAIRPFLRFCQPAVSLEGEIKPRSGLYSVMALHVLRNRNHRFVAVSKGENFFDFHHPTFSIFYGQFSERYDVRAPISSQLPFRPNDGNQPIQFFFLPGHESQLETVKRYYPTGEVNSLPYSWGYVISYTVSGEEVRRVFNQSLENPTNFDRNFFALQQM